MSVFVFSIVLLLFRSCYSSDHERRLVLHSDLDIDQAFKSLQSQLDQLNRTLRTEYEQKLQQFENEKKQKLQQQIEIEVKRLEQSRGSTYVRWGRTTCGGNGTQKVYSGFAAGAPFDIKGAAVDYICLPEHPSWAKYVDGLDKQGGQVVGAEYEFSSTMSNTVFGTNLHDQDVPCAVCKSPRPSTLMIPGQTGCYNGWNLEYTGYLMSGLTVYDATEYVCMDSQPETLYHGEANTNGKLFYFVEIHCGGLPCQVYPEGRELACVVCSQ